MNRRDTVVRKYGLDTHTIIKDKNLGPGPVMAPEAIDQFVRRDPSRTGKYLDWMLFVAGGGQAMASAAENRWTGCTVFSSSRDEMREDFMRETAAKGIPAERAAKDWQELEPRCRAEFILGDQDVCNAGSYGFYRHWPGKDEIYEKVCRAIELWHAHFPKLKAHNEKLAASAEKLEGEIIELDIYAGWKPNDLCQPKATYNSLDSLMKAMAVIQENLVLKDRRALKIFDTDDLLVVVPLTVGASIHYGISKWCTANLTELKRCLRGESPTCNWTSYGSRGPLVYFRWKKDVPADIASVALHITDKNRPPWEEWLVLNNWYDAQNLPESANNGLKLALRYSMREGALFNEATKLVHKRLPEILAAKLQLDVREAALTDTD